MAFSKLDGKGIDLSSNVLTSFASTGIDDNATSTAITIDSSGLVGINDTSPTVKLNVASSSNVVAKFTGTNEHGNIQIISAGTTNRSRVQFGDDDLGYSGSVQYLHDVDAMMFATSNTERVRIDSSGNVGIRTTTPSAKLHVNGDDLGSTQYDKSQLGWFHHSNGNVSYLEVFGFRDTAGSDWTTSATRIEQRIDSTSQTYIQFNGTNNNYGISFGAGAPGVTNADSEDIIERMCINDEGKITYGGTGRKSYLIGNDTGDNVAVAAGETRYIRVAKIATGYHTLRMAPWGHSAYHGAEINIVLNWNSVTGSDHAGFHVLDLKKDAGFVEIQEIYGERISNEEAYIWVKIYNSSGGSQTYNFDLTGLEYTETATLALSNTTTSPGLTSRPAAYTLVGEQDPTSDAIHIFRGNSDHYVSSGASIMDFIAGSTSVGSITASGTSGVNYNTTSDISLKENIQDAESASGIIDSLKIRQFDWKDSQEHQSFGVVAQEVEPIFTDAVTQDEIWSVDYSKFVPLLIKEIQELRARVAELENS